MEETFSSLVHPLPPPLSIPSPSPPAHSYPRLGAQSPASAVQCASPVAASPQQSGLQAVNICPLPQGPASGMLVGGRGRAGCWWEADAHPVGPRGVGAWEAGAFCGDFHHRGLRGPTPAPAAPRWTRLNRAERVFAGRLAEGA